MKKIVLKNETLVALTIVGLSLLIGLINPAFFSVANLFDIARNCVITGIFAVGVLIVLISGGIDVSFTAIAAFSMYVTCKILELFSVDSPLIVVFLISGGIGILLGLINAALIYYFSLPTMIVTLGTQSLYRGFMLAFIGTAYIIDIPQSMIGLSKYNLIHFAAADKTMIGLHSSILFLIAVIVLGWLILRFTMIGRGIYAIGGDIEAAKRVGFNVKNIQFFVYSFVGLISGIAGIIQASLTRVANPFDIVGTELNVIAAVVLGGARITGGYGTIIGTMLGVCLVVIINNSLILLGVPSYCQQVVTGLLILMGTGIPAYQSKGKESGREQIC